MIVCWQKSLGMITVVVYKNLAVVPFKGVLNLLEVYYFDFMSTVLSVLKSVIAFQSN